MGSAAKLVAVVCLIAGCDSPAVPPGAADAAPPDAAPVPMTCGSPLDCPLDAPACGAAGTCGPCAAASESCRAALADTVCGPALGSCAGPGGTCVAAPPGVMIEYHHDTINDRHFYSASKTPPPGFTWVASAFRLVAGADTAPLYMLFSTPANDYMTSRLIDEASAPPFEYASTGQLGAIFTVAKPGTYPLRRFYQADPLRHASAIDAIGGPGGYDAEADPQGYVCPP